jgi:hypothetical protein
MLFRGLVVFDPLNTQEESVMNRSIPLSMAFVVVLASQVALAGCSKKEDVGAAPPDTSASAPDTSASSAMSTASATPMDSASAAMGSDAASAADNAASH